MRKPILLLCACAAALGQRQELQPGCACNPQTVDFNRQGLAAHANRCLTEASAAYTRALQQEPPAEPSAADRDLVLRYAPRVFVTVAEPFRLKDVVAILHPTKRWIAYHLFWEDDIDFPDDNDPCDHEVVWVALNSERSAITGFYTYFHGRVVAAPAATIDDARAHGGRVKMFVQWGKHGSLPLGWEQHGIRADAGDTERGHLRVGDTVPLSTYQEATWRKLSTQGRQDQNSPLGRKWPRKFEGSLAEFNRFTKAVDLPGELRRSGNVAVSCLNNAVINRHFLPYNFAAKIEWPEQICEQP